MSGTINVVCYKSVDNGAYSVPATGQTQRKYLQTKAGGSAPGAFDVTEDISYVDFGSLTDPGFVKLENISTEYDVIYGVVAEEGSGEYLGMRLRKRVESNGQLQYDGGIGFIELAEGALLAMQLVVPEGSSSGSGSTSGSAAPTARVQISAEDR